MLSRRPCDGQRQVPNFFEFCFVRFSCEILLVSMYCSLRCRPILHSVNNNSVETRWWYKIAKHTMKFQHGQNRCCLFTLLDAPGH